MNAIAHEAWKLTGGYDQIQRLEMKRESDESAQDIDLIDALESGIEVTTRDGRKFKFAGINYAAKSDEVIAGWVDDQLMGFTKYGRFLPSHVGNLDLLIKGDS